MNSKLPERIESKYLVPRTHSFVLDLLFQFFPKSQWRHYKVKSLYYDTLDLQSYHQKKNGDYYRKKFRLRYYDDPKTNLFVEVKEKRGKVVHKTRQKIKSHSHFNFATSFFPLAQKISEVDARSGLMPIMWTHYERKAIDLPSNSYFRITVDRGIGFSQFNNRMANNSSGPVFSDLIVEVKHAPESKDRWLQLVAKHLKNYQSNFSKYEWALEQGRRGVKWI